MSLILLNRIIIKVLIGATLQMAVIGILIADEVHLEGLDGKSHVLSEYIGKGKWTVLNIWGPKCPPCRDEMPDLVQFHDTHQAIDAMVIGIAIDFPSFGYAKKNEVIEFAEDFMIDFPLLLSDGTITERLNLGRLEGMPTTYMYTPEGKLVGMQVGGITRTILEQFMKKHKK